MILYGRLIIEIKVSWKVMLFLLKREFFDCLYSKEKLWLIYRMLAGRAPGEAVTDNGKYKLTVTGKKRLKICLQNQTDNVIYKYNVRIRFLWKKILQDAMCEGIMDIAGKTMYETKDKRITDS